MAGHRRRRSALAQSSSAARTGASWPCAMGTQASGWRSAPAGCDRLGPLAPVGPAQIEPRWASRESSRSAAAQRRPGPSTSAYCGNISRSVGDQRRRRRPDRATAARHPTPPAPQPACSPGRHDAAADDIGEGHPITASNPSSSRPRSSQVAGPARPAPHRAGPPPGATAASARRHRALAGQRQIRSAKKASTVSRGKAPWWDRALRRRASRLSLPQGQSGLRGQGRRVIGQHPRARRAAASRSPGRAPRRRIRPGQ